MVRPSIALASITKRRAKFLGQTVISAKVLAIAFIFRMDCGRTIRFNDADQQGSDACGG
jgi:hypothetical protein